jgi:ribonuclease Z
MMRKGKRWLVTGGLVASGILLAGVGILAVPSVDDAIFTHFVKQQLREGNDALLKGDGLRVLLCGTSAPFADPHRAQSCTAIIAGGHYYLVDTGPGSGRNLELWQLRGRELSAVFLTHFHSDHIGDLGEVNTNAWLAGHPGSLQVFGGPGVERVVDGFNEAYSLDQGYRTANSGAQLLPPSADEMQAHVIEMQGAPTPAKDRRSLPMYFGDLTVTAIEVNHDPAEPAYGYRFDYHGRSVVVSGDTNFHPPLAVAAQGADVLVHEAQSQHLVQLIQKAAANVGNARIAQTMNDIQHYHTDPLDASRIANQAGVKLLVFTHLDPPPSNALLYWMFYRGLNKHCYGNWMSGRDGTLIDLPIGSTKVIVETIHP